MPRLQKHAEAIMELFREYDADDDGKLSKEEVEKMIENEILDDDIKVRSSTHSCYMTQLQFAHT